MPIAGFKEGMRVLTPSGNHTTVTRVKRTSGRERVCVAFYGKAVADRWFDAQALRTYGIK